MFCNIRVVGSVQTSGDLVCRADGRAQHGYYLRPKLVQRNVDQAIHSLFKQNDDCFCVVRVDDHEEA